MGIILEVFSKAANKDNKNCLLNNISLSLSLVSSPLLFFVRCR